MLKHTCPKFDKQGRKVTIVPYDKLWPNYFEEEATHLREVLKGWLADVHHIGSTAILNMSAKPILDIILELEDFNEIENVMIALQKLGYAPLSRSIIPYRSFFTSKYEPELGVHLHLYERGDPQIGRHVNFKDFLNSHPECAQHYAELKLSLAQQFSDDIKKYVMGKERFVQEIDAEAKVWTQERSGFLSPFTGLFAKAWSAEKIIKATEANLNIFMTHFPQYLNTVELKRVPGVTIVNTNLKDVTLNCVLDAKFNNDEAKEKVKEITEYFMKKNIPFYWLISPHDQPDSLSKILEKNHYEIVNDNPAMYLDLDRWKEKTSDLSDLKIIRAVDEKTLFDFALLLAREDLKSDIKKYYSWIAKVLTEDDPIQFYVGYVGEKPVMRGASCHYAGVAGLYQLGTTPDERQKGYGQAMQYFRLNHAKKQGYHIAVLPATKTDYSLYKKIGYQECGMFKEYKLS